MNEVWVCGDCLFQTDSVSEFAEHFCECGDPLCYHDMSNHDVEMSYHQ